MINKLSFTYVIIYAIISLLSTIVIVSGIPFSHTSFRWDNMFSNKNNKNLFICGGSKSTDNKKNPNLDALEKLGRELLKLSASQSEDFTAFIHKIFPSFPLPFSCDKNKPQSLEKEEEESSLITNSEMSDVLTNALKYMKQSPEEIKSLGWKLVHESLSFSLYKKRDKPKEKEDGHGVVLYLMFGSLGDVSPRTLLSSQIAKEYRELWDTTMKDMKSLHSNLEPFADSSEDTIYYRTKWPWPLKDRDYTLVRRCKIFPENSTIVFVSKSIETDSMPKKDGVIRVENYWCQSAFVSHKSEDIGGLEKHFNTDKSRSAKTPAIAMSKNSNNPNMDNNKKNIIQKTNIFNKNKNLPKPMISSLNEDKDNIGKDIDLPGTSFVTLFCDDARVPLPPQIVDLLSKQAEKLVPSSIERLYVVARDVQARFYKKT